MDHNHPYKNEAQEIRDMILLEKQSLRLQDELPESSHAFLSLALVLAPEDMLLGKAIRATKNPSTVSLQVLTPKRCIEVTVENEIPCAIGITPFAYKHLVVAPQWSETDSVTTMDSYKIQIKGINAERAVSLEFTYDIDHFIDPDLVDMVNKVFKLNSLLQ